MKISNLVKILCFLFLITACEKKKQIIVEKIDNTKEIKKLIDKGKYYFDTFNDSAIYCFDKSISLCNPIDDYADDYVYALTLKANILQNNGDFYESEEELTKTLPYLEKTSKPKFIYNVYTIMAFNYSHNYDYKNALLYHQKALKLADTPFKKSVLTADIAILYLNQGKYKEAIHLLEPLVEQKVKHATDSTRTLNHYSLLYNNLGCCYMNIGNPKALDCLEKSLQLILPTNDYYELIGTYNILAIYHNRNKNTKLAKFYAEKAYFCSIKGKAAIMKVNCLARLMNWSEGDALKKYSQLYISLIDSINDARITYKNQSSALKFNFKKDKKENLVLKSQKAENELQLQRQKNRSFISYIIITISIISLAGLAFYIITKGKKEKNDIVLKSEMRISGKLQDELSKKVYQTFLFAENNDLKNIDNKEKLLSSLNDIYIKTRNISKENSQILTDERYVLGLKDMISEYKTQNINILLNGFDVILWNTIDKNIKIVLYRILQELFQNMKNHSNANLISVALKSQNKILNLNYTDNGEGIRTNKIIFKKGLQNLEDRIKSVKGHVDISSLDHGFKVFIKLPI